MTGDRSDVDVDAFRDELARLRAERGLSQRELGLALANGLGGVKVTGSAVGEWERGPSLPSRRNVEALERVLELEPGALAGLLGYSTGAGRGVMARLERLEENVSRIEALLEQAEGRRSPRRR